MRTRISITFIGIVAALALVAVPAASAATDVHRANLNGSAQFPGVSGKAKFSRDDGVRQLEAQIEDANLRQDGPVPGQWQSRRIGDGQWIGHRPNQSEREVGSGRFGGLEDPCTQAKRRPRSVGTLFVALHMHLVWPGRA